MRQFRNFFLASIALAAGAAATAQNQPMLPENSVTRVSDHVYAIVGFPNIGIVIGNRATLVVDTGMGPRNGAIIVREVDKLTQNPKLFLTTTHFHPEHAAGEGAFPPHTILIRPIVQQEEIEKSGAQMVEMFSKMSPKSKELLQGVRFRQPDVVFGKEAKLDLGGVTARLLWLGEAHTRGDELIFVEEDRTLISGDIVQNKLVPAIYGEDSSVKNWLAILDQLEPLSVRFVLPDHGPLGDGSLVAKERAFLKDLQARALELKGQGTSVDDAARMVTAEFKMKYPDYTNPNAIPNVVRRVYREGQ